MEPICESIYDLIKPIDLNNRNFISQWAALHGAVHFSFPKKGFHLPGVIACGYFVDEEESFCYISPLLSNPNAKRKEIFWGAKTLFHKIINETNCKTTMVNTVFPSIVDYLQSQGFNTCHNTNCIVKY